MSLNDLRKYRIKINDFDIAAFDTIGTLIIGIIIAKKTNTHPFVVLPSVFLIGEIVHVGFGIDTPITQQLINE